MTSPTQTPIQEWLGLSPTDRKGVFQHSFHERHIGNTFIRSIHGGASAGISELCAQMALRQELGDEIQCDVVTSTINYLRATKDSDILARAHIVRITRRAAFIDVVCWQDEEDQPITKGSVTLQIVRPGT